MIYAHYRLARRWLIRWVWPLRFLHALWWEFRGLHGPLSERGWRNKVRMAWRTTWIERRDRIRNLERDKAARARQR